MASTGWITGIVLLKCMVFPPFLSTTNVQQKFHCPHLLQQKKCFMILTITLGVMRGGLMLHFCLILQQHEMYHRIIIPCSQQRNMN